VLMFDPMNRPSYDLSDLPELGKSAEYYTSTPKIKTAGAFLKPLADWSKNDDTTLVVCFFGYERCAIKYGPVPDTGYKLAGTPGNVIVGIHESACCYQIRSVSVAWKCCKSSYSRAP